MTSFKPSLLQSIATQWFSAAMLAVTTTLGSAADVEPEIPRFSVEHMDRSVAPGTDFYQYASGTWAKKNPVPSDKPSWGAFAQLRERNQYLIKRILEESVQATEKGPEQQVGNFFRSALDTNRLEQLQFSPVQPDLKKVMACKSVDELFELMADLHRRGVSSFFGAAAYPDQKKSSVYGFYLSQGGLGMPDREYYLSEGFAKIREAYQKHITKMFRLLGDSEEKAIAKADRIISLETALAQGSKSKVDLRDALANYHKFTRSDLLKKYPGLPLSSYLAAAHLTDLPEMIVGQPAFFGTLETLLKETPMEDLKTYVSWHIISSAAPYLHEAASAESFAFYGAVINGIPEQEPRWKRAARVIDDGIGEAVGEVYVQKHFTPAARKRMNELIDNLEAVFRDRLGKLEWMTPPTREKALAKFARFKRKIGHPDKFRDYSSVEIKPDDYLGNVQRAEAFDTKRRFDRIGKPVDKNEWSMTPQTVNAYFSGTQNEIAFPAGILQPPFFDLEADDAVNYGAIGYVIGHEITHGYDDQGRKYDIDGNLNDWWTAEDSKAFEARAEKLVEQYNQYEALPGLKVNGRLSLGENIADLGGASIAYEALQRALAKDPSKRKMIDGFTPEQRFFLSMSQVWRINWRDAALQRQITVGPHSPGQFRAVGPHVNLQEFYDAFDIKPGEKMYKKPEDRVKIW
ncbi:MAG: M13 family metallopeptidase [Verrucomicrobiota bacterium]|nr:M13 family metallopeptidase [Verrucomicrobiota bacterium]